MSYAPNYTPTTSFAEDESNQASGRSTVRTASLDREFADIEATTDALGANQRLVQRDDGKLNDLLIEPYAISEQLRAMLVAAGSSIRGPWAPNQIYQLKDLVQRNGVALMCQLAHNSGPVFNLGFWIAISGDGQAAAYAQQAQLEQTLATQAAESATASATSAATSATVSSTSASSALASQAAAQASADSIASLSPVNLTESMQDFLSSPSSASALARLGGASLAALVNSALATMGANLVGFNPLLSYAEGTVGGFLLRFHANLTNVKDFKNDNGSFVKGDGVQDDTTGIQRASAAAAGMFNQTAFPPAGSAFDPPTLVFPSGAFRITDTINIYPGLTVYSPIRPSFTVECSRIIMDTLSGTANTNKHIFKLTRTFESAQRVNTFTCTIENIAFWITNPGSTIPTRGGAAFMTGSDGLGVQGVGCHIYCDEPAIDVRILRCSHYSTPNAAVWFNQSGAVASDVEISDCEYDTPGTAIRFTNGALYARIYNCQWYNNSFHVHATGVTGSLAISGGKMQLNGRIKVSGELDRFELTGVMSDGAMAFGTFLDLNRAKQINIGGNSVQACSGSTFFVTDADGGTISGNTINNSGYNATTDIPTTDPGAIRLVGCQNVVVGGNSLLTTGAATYNGFGIVTHDSTRPSRVKLIGNLVATRYNGAGYRSQGRRINITPNDTYALNEFSNDGSVSPEYRTIETPAGRFQTIPAQAMTAGTYDIPLAGIASLEAAMNFSALSSAVSMSIGVSVRRNSFDGTYVIGRVSRDAAYSVTGAQVLTTGNTVAFSISGTNLRMTFVFGSDPMVWDAVLVGSKY